jgi:hypothetical protein
MVLVPVGAGPRPALGATGRNGSAAALLRPGGCGGLRTPTEREESATARCKVAAGDPGAPAPSEAARVANRESAAKATRVPGGFNAALALDHKRLTNPQPPSSDVIACIGYAKCEILTARLPETAADAIPAQAQHNGRDWLWTHRLAQCYPCRGSAQRIIEEGW